MVGQIDEKEEIQRALKAYILRDRDKQRLEEEAEAEKTRKKKEYDEKKVKEESELKNTKEKLAEIAKKHEQLQQDKIKIFEHLKKVLGETNRHVLGVDDLSRLYEIGLAVTCVSTVPTHPSAHPTGSMPAAVIPRSSTLPPATQFKTSVTSSLPVQTITHQKRNRSPSPTIYRTTYNYKQAAGPHAFQKLEDSHRNHEYRSYLFKSGNPSQSGAYSAFYPPSQSTAYTLPSSAVHNNAPVYSNYGTNRENADILHKAQQQSIVSVPPSPSPSQHSSLYPPHRSSIQSGTPVSVSSNHVSYLADHSKNSSNYLEDKYYLVRPSTHVPIHGGGVIPLQQASQSTKHGSITSGYPVRPAAAQINTQPQLVSQHGGNHSSSQASPHTSQTPLHTSAQAHHSSLSSHQPSQSQSHSQQNVGSHQIHHQSSSGHYQQSQAHLHHQVTQSSQPPSVSVSLSQQTHHSGPHQQQHIQQMHSQSHHPSSQSPSSHHQLIQHHTSPSIHHTSTQQHMQQIHHHHHHHQQQQQQQQQQQLLLHQQQQQQQQHHQQQQQSSHSQAVHHSQIQQPHIQQHISSHQQQSQPTPVVTSQAVTNPTPSY